MGKGKDFARSISLSSRTAAYKRRKAWAVKSKNGGKFPVFEKQEKPEPPHVGPKKFYPAEDVKRPLARRMVRKPTRLRESISPGTILILLAGRFKGKRVLFLKQMESGLLLVAGPYSVNGVPARRVNQTYVIATSTKVELPAGLDLSAFTDDYFKAAPAEDKDAMDVDTEAPKPKGLDPKYVESQKALDASLKAAVSKDADVKGYLKTRFTLRGNDRPHLMKF